MSNQMKISEYIHPIVQFGKVGSVHTVFPYAFNLQVGEQIIHVSSSFEYLASYGLALPKKDFVSLIPYVRRGDFVKINHQEMVFYSQRGIKHLSLIDAEIRSLDVRDLGLKVDDLQLLKLLLEKQKLAEKLGLPLDERTLTIFKRMRSQIGYSAEIHSFLLGRGKGGTPSGDDILVGYLSILHGTNQAEAADWAQRLLGKLATSDVSEAYLHAVANGSVNSLIYQILFDLKTMDEGLIEHEVHQLMAIGHTSGKDLSYGLLLGIQALQNMTA